MNPNPLRIPAAVWRLWEEFHTYLPDSQLGGVYAAKPGYHNFLDALGALDYSRRDLVADREGPRNFASALDITLDAVEMRRHTNRLHVAALAHDPRLYTSRGPVLREFIGTLDSRSVFCYVLIGGKPLGVPTDAGPDPGRDKTHLWHIHLSIIRRFCDDWSALDGVLSVLRDEPLKTWLERTDDLTPQQAQQLRDASFVLTTGIPNPAGDGRVPLHVWAAWVTGILKALPTLIGDVDDETRKQLAGDLAKLTQAVNEVDENVISALPGRTDGDLVRLLTELLGEDRAKHVARLVLGEPTA